MKPLILILPLILFQACTTVPRGQALHGGAWRPDLAEKASLTDGETSALEEFQGSLSCRHSLDSFKCVKYVSNPNTEVMIFDIEGVHPLFGKSAKVQLVGVRTPDLRARKACERKKASTAKEFINKVLTEARRIDLENIKMSKNSRILADVKFDGMDLKESLLSKKYAYLGKRRSINWCNQ
jgi:endonuclease YncB( thermonuclease family)